MATRITAQTRTHNEYTVGWVCALPKEQTAATAMLDQRHADLPKPLNDPNTYTLGSFGKHNAVIACLPKGQIGNNPAATVAAFMVSTFPSIRFGLMVGIGGGIPPKVRLGDVVVSTPVGQFPGVVQWDFGKAKKGGSFERTGSLNNPPTSLLTALTKLETEHEMKGSRTQEYLDELKRKWPKLVPKYLRSDSLKDVLFNANYSHVAESTDCGSIPGRGDEEEGEENCRFCDKTQVVRRKPRDMRVHYGLIASGNQVIKDATFRDRLIKDLGGHVLCVEMEAAGLVNNFPCIVIRGICDYADSHRNQDWQEHAAATAAAFAKDLLQYIQPGDVNRERPVKDILSQVCDVVSTIRENTMHTRAQLNKKEDAEILDWLTPVDYGPQQSDYFGNRQQGTGQWFLESAEYREWLDADGKTLFCPGIPGAGKTILSSIVINNLHTRLSDNPNIGISYIYCNFRQEQEQKINNLLASLVKQLSRGWHGLPESVNSLYGKHKKDATRPSVEELSATLQYVIELYTKVFITVDALDECQALDDCRGKLLSEILRLQDRSTVNFFATSRPIPEITKIFQQTLCLEIRATEEDVTLYLERHIGTLRPVIKTNSRLQEQIKIGISDAVDGMFLLAHIYLQFFKDKVTENDVRSALKEIQKQKQASGGNKHKLLSGAYDQIMERINRQKLGLRELAIQVLSWITCVKRQLTVIELQHALATKQGNRTLDAGDIVPVEDIVSVCAGLVTVDRERDIIRLNHYTAQQYLNDKRNELFPKAEFNIMTTCLTYLSFDVFGSGFCRTDEEFEERMRLNPFYHYSACYWGSHAYDIKTLSRAAIDFLESTTRVESSVQALMNSSLAWTLWRPGYSQKVPRQLSGLHLTAFFGLEDGVQVFGSSCCTLNTRDSDGRTALSYAAEKGHETVVKLFLDKGDLDIDSNDKCDRTPLWWAATRGHEAIVKLFLDTGKVDVDAQDRKGRSPLRCAVEHGYEAIIKLLHDEGKCDLNIQDEFGQTALSWAAERGQEARVKLLLNLSGVDVKSEDGFGRTPLWLAVEKGHNAIVKMLFDTGNIDVNTRDADSDQTIFSWAAMRGREFIVQTLLRTGNVDVDTRDVHYSRTPLSWAAMYGHKAIVELLLSLGGVEPDAQDSTGRTPLSLAAERGHEAIVHLLLNTGKVNVAARDNLFGLTPLDMAIEQKHEAIVDMLRNSIPRVGGASQSHQAKQDVVAKRARRRLRKQAAHGNIRFQIYVSAQTEVLPTTPSHGIESYETSPLVDPPEADRSLNRAESSTLSTDVVVAGGEQSPQSTKGNDLASQCLQHLVFEEDLGRPRNDGSTRQHEEEAAEEAMPDLESEAENAWEPDPSSESDVSDMRSEVEIDDEDERISVSLESDAHSAKCFLERNWGYNCDCEEEAEENGIENTNNDEPQVHGLLDMIDYWRSFAVPSSIGRASPHAGISESDGAQLDWSSILSGGDNRSKLDIQMSQRSSPDVQHTWDMDSIISWATCLSASRGLYISYHSPPTRNLASNVHVFHQGTLLHIIPHLRLGNGRQSPQFGVYVFFPGISHVCRTTTYLTINERRLWIDELLLPAIRHYCPPNVIQHHPRSFDDVESKAYSCQREACSRMVRSKLDMHHYLPQEYLQQIWQHIRQCAERSDLAMFRGMFIVLKHFNWSLTGQAGSARVETRRSHPLRNGGIAYAQRYNVNKDLFWTTAKQDSALFSEPNLEGMARPLSLLDAWIVVARQYRNAGLATSDKSAPKLKRLRKVFQAMKARIGFALDSSADTSFGVREEYRISWELFTVLNPAASSSQGQHCSFWVLPTAHVNRFMRWEFNRKGKPLRGLDFESSMRDTGVAWLPRDLFDWSNFHLQDDLVASTTFTFNGLQGVFRNWKGVKSASKEYGKAGELEDYLRTSEPNTRSATLDRMRKMVYRHFALQVIRYICSHAFIDYELENELRLAREGYQGLSFDITHKLTGEPPYLYFSHKGPHDLGYAYHDRVHGLFDWDDGLPRTFWDHCYYRQLARRFHSFIEAHLGAVDAERWKRSLGKFALPHIWIIPYYNKHSLFVKTARVAGQLNPTRPFISGLHQRKMGVDDTEFDKEDRWLLGGSYHMSGIPDSLMMGGNSDPEIGSETGATETSEAFAINFGYSIPFTEIPSCIERGMELTRDLYSTSRPKVLAHYESARDCLEQALGDPLCDLLLMIVLTFTSSTVTPALPVNKKSFKAGPKRNRQLLAVTLMAKMLWFLCPQWFPWQNDNGSILGIPEMAKQMAHRGIPNRILWKLGWVVRLPNGRGWENPRNCELELSPNEDLLDLRHELLSLMGDAVTFIGLVFDTDDNIWVERYLEIIVRCPT
ncbi:hypothetical protein FSARC_13898 [Fusarium sarcochroum]|uniref:Nucleoside phosphorylase domain-containing protein n=1 Tax=Fusarium sarcochroum TaxID=1208366 RepID=A0A8H4SXX2_9HYPO|nr:hypothetical protein FSARC_13898 [Fusarium sarcochroum]